MYDVFGKGYEGILEAMRKARRLNNHVFSMLRARCPLEDKVACAIKPSGAPLHRMKFMNTVSAFETLPQRATWLASRQMCRMYSCMWGYMLCCKVHVNYVVGIINGKSWTWIKECACLLYIKIRLCWSQEKLALLISWKVDLSSQV